ncbi:unnamed protein product, partial [Phaeothamnion confervicola]
MSKWHEEQMAPTPTLLPSLRFHDLVFGHELGRGTFSVVRYARRILPGLMRSRWPEYAVKIIAADRIRELRYARSVANEVAVLRLLSHPSVARMVSAFRWRDGAYLVLEHASRGDLHAHLVAHGSLDEHSARFVVGEVMAALCSVHDAGFVYGDLKPENVLITESGHIKLTDFGACRPATAVAMRRLRESRGALARLRDGDWRAAKGLPPAEGDPGSVAFERWEDDDEEEEEEREEAGGGDGGKKKAVAERVEGTPAYLPPEVLAGKFPDLLADAWALGCLLYQCLTGRPPFFADTEEEVWAHAVRFFGAGGCSNSQSGGGIQSGGSVHGSGDGGVMGELPEGTSQCARELLAVLMERDRGRRLTVEAAAGHSFFMVAALVPGGGTGDGGGTRRSGGGGGGGGGGIDVFALHRGPAVPLARGAVAAAPAGAAWARRQNSMIWAPMPQEFALEAQSRALAALEETPAEADAPFG